MSYPMSRAHENKSVKFVPDVGDHGFSEQQRVDS